MAYRKKYRSRRRIRSFRGRSNIRRIASSMYVRPRRRRRSLRKIGFRL